MAQRNKKSPQHTSDNKTPDQSGYRPEDFEEIKLPLDASPDEQAEQEFTEIHPEVFLPGIQQPSERLLAAKEKLVNQFLIDVSAQAFSAESGSSKYGFENIVGVGISEKMRNGQFIGKKCVTVYVVSKEPVSSIHPQALIPESIQGIPTDVVITGELHAFPHRGVYRPAPGGVSVGHYQITAGTIACLVRRGQSLFVLSNNHVLAHTNQGRIGDPILQPGPFDGGIIPDHVIGQLSQFVPIQFGGQLNMVDCAIAQVSPSLVTPLSKCYGRINATPQACTFLQVVKKCGRTTQSTTGFITDCNATVRVGYGAAGTAIFQDQIIIIGTPFPGGFSQPGDSGSLILNKFFNRPVGLLFAGSATHTIANKIQNVLNALNVSIVT